MAVRQKRAERTREHMLVVAAEEFARFGVSGMRVDRVLARAGLTKGALYHHFDSKEAIAHHVAEAERAHWSAVLAESGEVGLRGLEALRNLAGMVTARLVADVQARAGVRIEAELSDGADGPIFVLWRDTIVMALQQALADGEIDEALPLPSVSTALTGSLYGFAMLPVSGAGQAAAAERADLLWHAIVAGLQRG